MRRRDFLVALGGGVTAWPQVALAQQSRRPLVGVLSPASEEVAKPIINAFRARLAELGYIDGGNIDIGIRYAPAHSVEEDRRLGTDLIALSPSVLVVGALSTIIVISKLTSSIPVVGVNLGEDPVGAGIVASLAHPGGNITGITYSSSATVVGKQLGYLKELAPSIKQVVALFTVDMDPVAARMVPDIARSLQLSVRSVRVIGEADFAAAIADRAADGFYFGPGPLFNTYRDEIVTLVAKVGRPAIYATGEDALAGGLIAYGPNLQKAYTAGAEYAAKILGGARPSDLPIEQPSFYELIINLKTAKELDLTVSPGLLASADQVIE